MPERGNHFLAMRITIYSGRQIKGSGFLDDIMELLHKTWTVCIRTSFYMRKINSYLVKSSRMSFYYMQPSTNPNEYKLQMELVRMKSSWFRVGCTTNDWCPHYKSEETQRYIRIQGRRPWEDRGRDSSDTSTNQSAKDCPLPPELRKGEEASSARASEGA